jgi:hypothetical protein
VLDGRDYQAPAAWLLRIPVEVLSRARRVHLWMAPKGAPLGYDEPPAWTSASVQWLEDWPWGGGGPEQQQRQRLEEWPWGGGGPEEDTGAVKPARHSSSSSSDTISSNTISSSNNSSSNSNSRGTLKLGPWSLLFPVRRRAGGPAIVHLRLSWPALTRNLQIKWRASRSGGAPAAAVAVEKLPTDHLHQLANSSSGGSSSSGSSSSGSGAAQACWQPALISAAYGGGDEHVRSGAANLTSLPLHFHLHARPRQSSGGGGGSSADGSVLMLVLDPRCEFSLWLTADLFAPCWSVLLGFSSISVGLTVALLLLALSHQLSALVRLSAEAAGARLPGSFQGGARPPSAGAAAAAPPSISLGGANLAPPAPTSLPRSLNAVLGDHRVWLYGAALTLLLLSAEWVAGSGTSSSGTSSSSGGWPGLRAFGAAGSAAGGSGGLSAAAALQQRTREFVRLLLSAAGLQRLAPRPPTAGVVLLALVAVTLLLINAQLVVALKCACGSAAALALRAGRAGVAAAAARRRRRAAAGRRRGRGLPAAEDGGSDSGGDGADDVSGRASGGGSDDLDASGCPTALLATPAAVLAACVAGPPAGGLDLGCGPVLAAACGDGGGRGSWRSGAAAGLVLVVDLLRGAGQLLLATAVSMPHPAVSDV